MSKVFIMSLSFFVCLFLSGEGEGVGKREREGERKGEREGCH